MSLDIYFELPACDHCKREPTQVFERNITYNLSEMWRAAGLPFSDPAIEGKPAGDMIPALESGLATLKAGGPRFRAMNPANGWGSYDSLLESVGLILAAARENPTAIVSCWR